MNLTSYLAQESLPDILRNAAFTRTLDATEVLFCQGDRASAFYIVDSGRIRTVRYTTDGAVVTLQVAREGDGVATEAPFSDRYSCTAICETRTRVTVYPKEKLLAILQDNPTLLMLFAKCLSESIVLLKNYLELRGTRSARSRILRYLNFVSCPTQKSASLDRPLKDIANEVGLAPEVLYRTLAQLEKEGRITRQKRFIQLH